MPSSDYTHDQRAALSFAALEAGDPGRWREIDPGRLSFTELAYSPLYQTYGSIDYGLHKLGILPGDPAALGFAATDPGDAELLEKAWKRLLVPADGIPRHAAWKVRP